MDELEGDELVTALLESANDLSDETTLDTVRLDGNEGCNSVRSKGVSPQDPAVADRIRALVTTHSVQ